jgi:TolB-like protein
MIKHTHSKKPITLCHSSAWPIFIVSLLGVFFLYSALSRAGQEIPETPATTDTKVNQMDVNQAEAFKSAIHQMATTLFTNLHDSNPATSDLADGIVVSSFVELKKLTRTSSFGRYLAEQLMAEFQQQGYRVVEIRKSTSIAIQEKKGEFGLSRDVTEINPTIAARTMITGTYTLAGDHILVNAKVLDNKTAALLSSATMVFPRTKLMNQLLADSVSASPRQQEPTSMKRLEL